MPSTHNIILSVHVLILQTCEYVTWCGKRNFADVKSNNVPYLQLLTFFNVLSFVFCIFESDSSFLACLLYEVRMLNMSSTLLTILKCWISHCNYRCCAVQQISSLIHLAKLKLYSHWTALHFSQFSCNHYCSLCFCDWLC